MSDVPIHHNIEGGDQYYSAPGATTKVTTYDDRGLPATMSLRDAAGSPLIEVQLSRDAEGRVLAEVARYGGASPFVLPDSIPIEERPQYAALLSAAFAEKTLSTTAYSYDAQGRLVERTRRMGILSEERTRFEYDDRGNPILETTEHHDREIELDDTAGARSKNGQARVDYTRFEYQYDANGNWTERIVSFRSGSDTDFRRSNVERRTISYYRS